MWTVAKKWKSTHVTPVHKSGDGELVGNYRPVSVLPVVVKVFEKLIHGQLYGYLQDNSILNPIQFGFRPRHTTPDVLVRLMNGERHWMSRFCYAFDSVDHSILLQKLERSAWSHVKRDLRDRF